MFATAVGTPWLLANFHRRVWRPLLAGAGLHYPLYSLRHAAASLWIAQGRGIKWISERMGHASVAFTLDIYGHLFHDPTEDRAAAEAN